MDGWVGGWMVLGLKHASALSALIAVSSPRTTLGPERVGGSVVVYGNFHSQSALTHIHILCSVTTTTSCFLGRCPE